MVTLVTYTTATQYRLIHDRLLDTNMVALVTYTTATKYRLIHHTLLDTNMVALVTYTTATQYQLIHDTLLDTSGSAHDVHDRHIVQAYSIQTARHKW